MTGDEVTLGGEGMVENRQRRPKADRILTRQQRVRLCLDRFGPLTRGERPKDLRDLSREYNLDEAVISRLIFRTFRERLVAVVAVDQPLDEPPLDLAVANQLENAYRPRMEQNRRVGLERALVLDDQDPDLEEFVKERPDGLMIVLGAALARTMAQGFFRPGDVIGWGAGRSVGAVAAALQRTPIRTPNITLLSLAGSIVSHPQWAEQRDLLADADLNLATAIRGFESEELAYRFRSFPICPPKADLTRYRKDLQNAPKLTHAIVGIGVMTDTSNVYNRIMCTTFENWKTLIGACSKLAPQLNTEAAVGDVGNRLFVTSAATKHLPASDVRELKRLVAKINDSLFAASAELPSAALLISAATRPKAHAISDVLMEYHVKALATDKATAIRLIEIAKNRPVRT